MSDTALAGLAALSGLTCLHMRHTACTNSGLLHLRELRLLGELDLGSR
jgi:hypothetical protein